jgi:hypothetical protein
MSDDHGVRRRTKFPSFDFFVSDWLAGAFRYDLTRVQQAVMLDLMARAWENGGELPDEPARLATLLNMDHEAWARDGAPLIDHCCDREDGRLLFVRPFNLPRQYAEALARTDRQADRGRRRAEGAERDPGGRFQPRLDMEPTVAGMPSSHPLAIAPAHDLASAPAPAIVPERKTAAAARSSSVLGTHVEQTPPDVVEKEAPDVVQRLWRLWHRLTSKLGTPDLAPPLSKGNAVQVARRLEVYGEHVLALVLLLASKDDFDDGYYRRIGFQGVMTLRPILRHGEPPQERTDHVAAIAEHLPRHATMYGYELQALALEGFDDAIEYAHKLGWRIEGI